MDGVDVLLYDDVPVCELCLHGVDGVDVLLYDDAPVCKLCLHGVDGVDVLLYEDAPVCKLSLHGVDGVDVLLQGLLDIPPSHHPSSSSSSSSYNCSLILNTENSGLNFCSFFKALRWFKNCFCYLFLFTLITYQHKQLIKDVSPALIASYLLYHYLEG